MCGSIYIGKGLQQYHGALVFVIRFFLGINRLNVVSNGKGLQQSCEKKKHGAKV